MTFIKVPDPAGNETWINAEDISRVTFDGKRRYPAAIKLISGDSINLTAAAVPILKAALNKISPQITRATSKK